MKILILMMSLEFIENSDSLKKESMEELSITCKTPIEILIKSIQEIWSNQTTVKVLIVTQNLKEILLKTLLQEALILMKSKMLLTLVIKLGKDLDSEKNQKKPREESMEEPSIICKTLIDMSMISILKVLLKDLIDTITLIITLMM